MARRTKKPVTVWRELRRLGDQQLTDHRMDAVLAAADVGDWAAYTQLQGGALVKRCDLVVRLAYEITEQGNEYAEDVQRVQGVYSPLIPDSEVCTRLVKWQKVAKLAEASTEAGGAGGNAAPWKKCHVLYWSISRETKNKAPYACGWELSEN